MARVRDVLILLGAAGLIVALDQWTKYLVRANLSVGEVWSPWTWLAPYARIVHWNNTGAAFGMLPSASLVFTVVAVLVSLAILYYFPRVPSHQWAVRLALVLQFAGAVGNLIDRLLRGTVTDFISVGTFPVWNVADACITVGVALLVAALWVEERQARQAPAPVGEVLGGAEPEGREGPSAGFTPA